MADLLPDVVREIEAHVAEGGWDQPARLFALVDTAELITREPQLAPALGAAGGITPLEQEELPDYASLEELLAGLAWPEDVAGAAVVVERVILPPGAEAALPADEAEALRVLSEHPDRQEVRLAVAVLRDGSRHAALRLRSHDADADVLHGPDLVPGLADSLAATLEP
ncbi:MAG: PPA1309 family protein [Actinomycetia bacterium]|jgi:hypothetical protein|nr:PPA1309 family protein [Actinomycetes bacterium]